MRIPDALVEKLLKQTGSFSDQQLSELHNKLESDKRSLQDIVVQTNLLSEDQLTKLYGDEIDVPVADFRPADLRPEILQLIPERIARQYKTIAFNLNADGALLVAMEDPDDIQAIGFLQRQLGRPLRVHIASSSAIEAAIDQYSGGESVGSELAKVIASEDKKEQDEELTEEAVTEDSPITQTVNLIIDYGIKARASDIHIEPREDQVIVRYRIDGILHEANKLPRNLLNGLVSRLKILADLKIDEHRAPQDGRFKIVMNDREYALRVSTLPILDGEKVVMRILDESNKANTLQELGYWGVSLKRLEQAIAQPHGLVLVTGPTGSGKSTSLFSVLSRLNDPSINISTIEDPVEYRIVGVNQTQVNPVAGMTFADGLRSLLRQDPNIIMVGEVRDGETADLAVQAALTGHLVFSTLHTNNAVTCLPRLLDMGVEPFLIASTVRVVVGQRLVRRVCSQCRQEYIPDDAVITRVKATFNLDGENDFRIIHHLEKEALEAGIGNRRSDDAEQISNPELSTSETTIHKLWKANEQGCDRCKHTGYSGRIGIYEVLSNTPDIQKQIISNTTSEGLAAQAVKDGMITMRIDGFIKALRGETTIEEIVRATSAEE